METGLLKEGDGDGGRGLGAWAGEGVGPVGDGRRARDQDCQRC